MDQTQNARNMVSGLMQQALAHHRAGQLAEAQKIYTQILNIDAQHADSLHLLGLIAMAASNYKVAEELIRKALAVNSSFIFHSSLGSALKSQGKLDEAVESYQRSLALKPDFADALNNLGLALSAQGKLAEAKESYARALAADPNHADTLVNMGLVLQDENKLDEAVAHYKKSIAVRPGSPEAHFNLGNALKMQNKRDEAITSYLQTLAIKPYPDAHINLGMILFERRLLDDAAMHFKEALKLQPDSLGALNNLAMTYNALNQYENAIACSEHALKIDPSAMHALDTLDVANKSLALTLTTLGTTYKSLGRMDDAISVLKRALSLDPAQALTYNNLLVTMIYAESVSPEQLFEESCNFGELIANPLIRNRPFINDKNPDRKLRVGYISPDFRNHAVNYFSEPLLTLHDSKKFEIFAYSNTEAIDSVTERLMKEVDHWRDIQFMNDDEAADLIESDKIDILVDLTGHTARNRLLVFARKPAPLQITWLGHPATSGMKAMDYRITDVHAEPSGMTEHLNVEKLWRLPDIFCCYKAHENSPDVIDHPPFEDNGYITFGCFNNFAKVTETVLKTWARILEQVPNSRLLLEITGIDHPKFKEDVEHRLKDFGFPVERVTLEPRKKSNQFNLYNKIDIALDPFPCAGGTTSMDTMWMGVPLVTLSGKHFVSRMGVTILKNAGLPELITNSIDGYITTAVDLANDHARLKKMRHNLRDKVARSPLMDQKSFANNMETAYRDIWRKWCESA